MIRPATYQDLDRLKEIFENAKKIMRESGNLRQWTGSYPEPELLKQDIDKGNSFVLCNDNEIIATIALIPGPDPTYSYIEGEWPDDEPYYVIHRIATSCPGRNVAYTLFDWASDYIVAKECNVIRIDTHADNSIMKHILSKYGFKPCGVIYLEDGAPRDAYHLSVRRPYKM